MSLYFELQAYNLTITRKPSSSNPIIETHRSPSKGKQPAARNSESMASNEDIMLELKANIQALQEAQVK
jgi:hypothetical protein